MELALSERLSKVGIVLSASWLRDNYSPTEIDVEGYGLACSGS